MKRALTALGYLWSAPLGLIGLLLAALFWACGWTNGAPVRMRGGLWVTMTGPLAYWLSARGWLATTVGWTVLVWVPTKDANQLFLHEGRHITQCLWAGPLFPIAYALCWLWALAQTRSLIGAYSANYLERDARRAAGE